MSDSHSVYNYKIVYDNSVLDKMFNITPEIAKLLQQYHPQSRSKHSGLFIKLNGLIKKYPHIPQFKNYLATAYMMPGNHQKASELIQWIMEEHPDYLYGYINQAAFFLQNNGSPRACPGSQFLSGSVQTLLSELRRGYPRILNWDDITP